MALTQLSELFFETRFWVKMVAFSRHNCKLFKKYHERREVEIWYKDLVNKPVAVFFFVTMVNL